MNVKGGSKMKLPRRNLLHLAAGAAALPAVSPFAWAQAYLTRPVHVIVGFTAGNNIDVVARGRAKVRTSAQHGGTRFDLHQCSRRCFSVCFELAGESHHEQASNPP
jgi:hypothetical protein